MLLANVALATIIRLHVLITMCVENVQVTIKKNKPVFVPQMANTQLSSLLLFITKSRKISYTVEENMSL